MKGSHDDAASMSPLLVARLALAVVARPRLWFVAMRCIVRFAPTRWWARAPFVPWPDAGYMTFRMRTVYGTGGKPQVHELVEYLDWLRGATR